MMINIQIFLFDKIRLIIDDGYNEKEFLHENDYTDEIVSEKSLYHTHWIT